MIFAEVRAQRKAVNLPHVALAGVLDRFGCNRAFSKSNKHALIVVVVVKQFRIHALPVVVKLEKREIKLYRLRFLPE